MPVRVQIDLVRRSARIDAVGVRFGVHRVRKAATTVIAQIRFQLLMIPVDDGSRLLVISVVLLQCRFVEEAVGAQAHGVCASKGNWRERHGNATRLALMVAALQHGS